MPAATAAAAAAPCQSQQSQTQAVLVASGCKTISSSQSKEQQLHSRLQWATKKTASLFNSGCCVATNTGCSRFPASIDQALIKHNCLSATASSSCTPVI
jgi:hypothetical protein